MDYNSVLLNEIFDISDKLYHVDGGIRETQFPEYHQNALDLLETLATYVPNLLKNEAFFHKAFFE